MTRSPIKTAAETVGIAARAAALRLLTAMLAHRDTLDRAMASDGGFAALAPRDRALAHNLVATTLRRLGEIDAALAACLEKPLPANAAEVLNVLRLGATQLLFLKTPAHAAVATAVELVAEGRLGRYKGLVNAVLRRIARTPETFQAGPNAGRVNTPDWLWARWSEAFGEETCRRIAETHLAVPPLDLSVRSDPDGWARRLNGRVLPGGTVRLSAEGSIARLDGYGEGAWWVQDAAAALPVRLLGDVKNRTVFDLCAAPGGKTAQLANAGANVVAVDRSPARVARIGENLARLKLDAACVVADALTWAPGRTADIVLLDAPCASTGTIRRHPDIPHVRKPEDIGTMAAVQAKLLRAAAQWVRPGGILLYCVCSLEAEEGPDQISRFLESETGFIRLPLDAAAVGGEAKFLTPSGDLRTLPCFWPDLGGMDGFYAARLRRIGA